MFSKSQGKSHRSQGREFAAVVWMVRHPGAVAAPAALMTSVAQFGTTATGAVIGGAAAGLGAWYRGHPDTFDVYAAPHLRAWRRRWAGAYRGVRWSDLMACCDLTKTHPRTGRMLVPRVLRVRSWTPSIDTVRIKLATGQKAAAFAAQAEELADSLGAQRVAVERVQPGQVVMIVQRDEPFTYTIPAPDMPEDVSDVDVRSLWMGEDEYGRDFLHPLDGSHYLHAGGTGSGKNSLIAIRLRQVAPLIKAGLVRPWIVDPKFLEWASLEPILDGRYANKPEDADDLLDAFVDNMQRKQKRMQRAKLRSVPVSEEYPLDWLIFDEIGYAMAYDTSYAHSIVGKCAVIASMGRATHDVLECAIQEPSKDTLPIRDLLPHRICLRVTSETHPDMVLGEGMRAKGGIADQIPPTEDTAGIGYAVVPRTRNPRRIRAAYTPDQGLTELVNYVKGPKLKAVS